MQLTVGKKPVLSEDNREFKDLLDHLSEDLETLNEVTTMVTLHLDARSAWQVMIGLRKGADELHAAPECQLTCDNVARVIEGRLPLTKVLKGVASRIADVKL